ncbi:MAG TPA: Flp family type IVb pilin [Flexivirga sp.]|uniref:Flp family type IVb pilin n=1 Tax=Flexivirga sp. TaxID=1962927 RepID=UPI002BC22CF9|nr:Flp family type IVb pilin [Flexivirga sp.]HWC22241.1 Flp family type IVb pilin [Flexivirga sp.]
MSKALTRAQIHVVNAVQGKKDRGATMVEYGLMLALIAIVCIVAVGIIGTNLNTVFTDIGGKIKGLAA